MNYLVIYQKIIKRAQERASSKKEANLALGYSEAHHIIPRCMGGTDELENIAHLSAEEHYVSHQLLVKIYPGHSGLLAALVKMSTSVETPIKNNKLYGWIRRKISKDRKGKNKDNDKRYQKSSETQKGRTRENYLPLAIMGDKRKGRTKENDPSTAIMAEKLSGRTKETHSYLVEAGKKVSEALTGRTKENDEGVAKMAETKRGRTKETCPSVAKMAETLTGRRKETHPGLGRTSELLSGRTKNEYEYLTKFSEQQNILSIEQRLLIIKMRTEQRMSIKSIHEYILSLGIQMAYSSVASLLQRETPNYKKFRIND